MKILAATDRKGHSVQETQLSPAQYNSTHFMPAQGRKAHRHPLRGIHKQHFGNLPDGPRLLVLRICKYIKVSTWLHVWLD
ncbi:MAG: hypothetical protein AAB308_01180, partial [Nitrospirota bacterium]